MNTQPHFEELLKLLEKNKVEYVIVGGYAMAFHGYPRFTKDIDIFFRKSKTNILALRKSLISFGFPDMDNISKAERNNLAKLTKILIQQFKR